MIKQINCYGYQLATAEWHCDHISCISRLYHIHSGKGGCYHNGKRYEFRPGYLYYIPFTEQFEPYTDAADPILHTYADLELVPPIMTEEILCANAAEQEMVAAAMAVFDAGGRHVEHQKNLGAEFQGNSAFGRFCTESMLYLISFIAKENGVPEIRDPVVLRALEILHERMCEPLTVGELADACYMNKDSFIRRFQKVVGMTPYAYLKNLRLNTALYLRSEGIDLATVAQRTGYADGTSLLHALHKK
jgi:AraC-like DNA-binding protein